MSKEQAKSKKATKKKQTKKVEQQKVEQPVNIETKQEFFGHKENEDIWQSFIVQKMFAHRGLHDEKSPENSLSAFEKAIEKGYAIELDVNPIMDGTPVVFHDSKMSRMTGKDKYIQNISREEFNETTLLTSGEKIPTLEEVLKFVDGRTPLLIEIKNQQKVGELEKAVWEILKNYNGEYAIQSFNPYTLQWFKNNAPKVWRGQLAGFFKGEKLSLFKKLVLRRLGMRKITEQNFVSYDLRNLPNRFVKHLEIPLLAWTINNQEQYIKSVQIADNVIFQNCEPKI